MNTKMNTNPVNSEMKRINLFWEHENGHDDAVEIDTDESWWQVALAMMAAMLAEMMVKMKKMEMNDEMRERERERETERHRFANPDPSPPQPPITLAWLYG